MSTSVKVRDDISIKTMLEEHASSLQTNGITYYFLPFWFKDNDTDDFEMLHLDHLPEELKKAIEFFRNPENGITFLKHNNNNEK